MQRKLSVRIIASLILSVMLFALPVGAFIANSSTAVSVYAEESVTGNEAGTTDDSSSSDDASDRGSTDEGTDTTVENPSSGDNSDAEDTSNTAPPKMNPGMVRTVVRLEKMIPHRLLNLHLSRNLSVSVTTSAASMITTRTALYVVRTIRTAHIRSRA